MEKLLFSVNTVLAFQIQRTYYDNIHYVWCTTNYDFGVKQPASSNPLTIAQNYFRDVFTKDRHSAIIAQNRSGIKRGAMEKRKIGVIDKETESKILTIVKKADYDSFLPLLYVIPYSNVKKMCVKAPQKEKAAPHSVEFLIRELPRNAFDLVDLRKTVLDFSEREFWG